MPNGKTHELINVILLIILLGVFCYLSMTEEKGILQKFVNTYSIIVFSLFYLFATFFLSPDLDVKSRSYKRWKILRILWWPYRITFKHRGFSHNLLFGPFIILVYFALLLFSLLILTSIEVQYIPLDLIIYAIIGIVLSIEIHILSDCLFTKLKSILWK
ncbi:MAG: DUF2227 family putative metal-binding protein [Methanomethylovorans sp.]|nr:DUF2227 family putative metal-binding protein [Methanomethylovorans sp.]